jgi:hypothetical protein
MKQDIGKEIASIPLEEIVKMLVENIETCEKMGVDLGFPCPELYIISQTYRFLEITKEQRENGVKQYTNTEVTNELAKYIEFKLKI